jgi:hypothetical protein
MDNPVKKQVILISVVVLSIRSQGKELVYRASLVSAVLVGSQEKVREKGANNDDH